ncbi:hypothetical protein DPMN_155362 [Dreissena polymorpha]|uniref:Uncharacterized protein n=1 Tax=Dreissena polymorpha TaxID=45954 RepID=A0A9D4FNQ2_DREPO|nr:hypothetical protein DPMN_155362 [Dreissena polymorpha]
MPSDTPELLKSPNAEVEITCNWRSHDPKRAYVTAKGVFNAASPAIVTLCVKCTVHYIDTGRNVKTAINI